MVETLEAPPFPSVYFEDDTSSDVADLSLIEHVLIDNLGGGDSGVQDAANFARRNNEVYYRGQARQFGFWLPLDPSRVNGVAYPVKDLPKREDYSSDEDYERARSDFADALSSQEKHALSGVAFN